MVFIYNYRYWAFFQVASILLSVSVRGLNFDYDEMPLNSTIAANTTNATQNVTSNATRNDTYPEIAKRLNCSKLVLGHRGVKVEEVRSDTVFKVIKIQRVPASTSKPDKPKQATSTTTEDPSAEKKLTFPPEIFEDNFSGAVPVPPGKSDLFGVSEDDPDPIAALLAGDAQEDQDPIAALLGQQSTTPTTKQQPRKLASGPGQNQVKSTTANEQVKNVKNETAKTDDSAVMKNSTKTHKHGGTNSTVKHECDYAFDDDGNVVYWYEVSDLSVSISIRAL